MSVFVDASALVSFFVADAMSNRVSDGFASASRPIRVSRWAATEFSSALAVRERARSLTAADREAAEQAFELWLDAGVELVEVAPVDFDLARRLIRSDRVVAKAADALHIAIAFRLGSGLVTLDAQMRRAASAIGVSVGPD